jgi:hypothetical protein
MQDYRCVFKLNVQTFEIAGDPQLYDSRRYSSLRILTRDVQKWLGGSMVICRYRWFSRCFSEPSFIQERIVITCSGQVGWDVPRPSLG